MLERIHVVGAYWCEDSNSPTPLGQLIAAAKDHSSESAVTTLQAQLTDFVRNLELPSTTTDPTGDIVVVPVPNGSGGNPRLVPALATSVADAMGVTLCEALSRRNVTARLRETPMQQRLAVVEAAGYMVNRSVTGQKVILVDDVVLTGTTLSHLAQLLQQAGAASVSAVVAARTRRADQ